jgi:hypothetical protein
MRQILITASIGAALAVAPALASKPAAKPDHPTKPPHPAKCKINSVGYNAKGTLDVGGYALTQSAGDLTPTDKSDDRYSGTLTVTVTKANHKGLKGSQTLTLTNAKVSFYDAANDGTDDVPPADGSTVRLHGKVTKYKHKCPGADTFVTVKRVSFQQAAAPAA